MLWYTVYDPETDDVLANGTKRRCAAALGLTLGTFETYVSRARRGRPCPFFVVVEDTCTGQIQTYPKQPQKEDPS